MTLKLESKSLRSVRKPDPNEAGIKINNKNKTIHV